MKEFKDLVFSGVSTPEGSEVILSMFTDNSNLQDIRATHTFSNGYGVSVIQGSYAYTDNTDEYEVAVLKDGGICYDTHITSDVLGHLSTSDVTKVMKQVQELCNE